MNVEKIYFDMDGVLADFERGVREICGVVPPDQNAKHWRPGDDDEMWEKIKATKHFYDRRHGEQHSRLERHGRHWNC